MQDRYNELINLKLELEQDIINIKTQLNKAKANYHLTGEMSDSKWFSNANYALYMKKLELKKINAEFEKLKRTMKQKRQDTHNEKAKTFEREFMHISKEILPIDEYFKILSLTQERVNQNGKTAKEEKTFKVARWTAEDEKYLEDNYKNFTIEELALELNRSENAIKSRIQMIKKRNKEKKNGKI